MATQERPIFDVDETLLMLSEQMAMLQHQYEELAEARLAFSEPGADHRAASTTRAADHERLRTFLDNPPFLRRLARCLKRPFAAALAATAGIGLVLLIFPYLAQSSIAAKLSPSNDIPESETLPASARTQVPPAVLEWATFIHLRHTENTTFSVKAYLDHFYIGDFDQRDSLLSLRLVQPQEPNSKMATLFAYADRESPVAKQLLEYFRRFATEDASIALQVTIHFPSSDSASKNQVILTNAVLSDAL